MNPVRGVDLRSCLEQGYNDAPYVRHTDSPENAIAVEPESRWRHSASLQKTPRGIGDGKERAGAQKNG